MKNAVHKSLVWLRIEKVNESKFLYDICNRLFCNAYMAAGSPDAVSDPVRVQFLNCFFRLPSAINKTIAQITYTDAKKIRSAQVKNMSY